MASATATLVVCSICADALCSSGGALVEGEIASNTVCQWHQGNPSYATALVEIERALMPARRVEEEIEIDLPEFGPVTELASRFLQGWGVGTVGSVALEPNSAQGKDALERSARWARALLKVTGGA